MIEVTIQKQMIIMEAALIRLLKEFTTQILSSENNIERIVENTFNNAEVTVSPSAKKELVSHIYNALVLRDEIPN